MRERKNFPSPIQPFHKYKALLVLASSNQRSQSSSSPSTMAAPAAVSLFLLLFSFIYTAAQRSIPLVSVPLTPHHPILSLTTTTSNALAEAQSSTDRVAFKYTRALVLSLPIGTPPQLQPMVLDTGSQLSWVQCHRGQQSKFPTSSAPSSTIFDPSLSSSFSALPCNTSLCQPPTPDYSVPTSCDDRRLCHYSYFYADGSLAEGNLALEALPLLSNRPVLLGCAASSSSSKEGILGMNLGRLSLASQTGLGRFSYCVPPSAGTGAGSAAGVFYAGNNPALAAAAGRVMFANLMRFDKSASAGGSLPYLDKSAYTVGLNGFRLGRARLNMSRAAFRPDAGGAGQTMVDSGTEFTFFTEEPYRVVKEAVGMAVGRRLRRREGTVYAGGLDICYEGRPEVAGVLVGEVAMQLEGGAELMIDGRRAWVDAGGGAACFTVGSSQLLGVESTIIGNHHQQNYWVEFDLVKSRLGFLRADCSRAT